MIHESLKQHIKNTHLVSDNTLHVVTMISNPIRFQSRIRLYRKFAEEMAHTPNVKHYTVEVAYGDREYEVTEALNPMHLRLRTTQEIWHKENALNLGVKHLLPHNWKYLAWVDADISFRNPGWAMETIHQLQHYPVVQPWSHCADLGPNGEVLQLFESFGFVHRKRVRKQTHPCQPYKYAHSGYAWACTRFFWENICGGAGNGLMDWCVLGSADHHMAWAMIGDINSSVHGDTTEGFKRKCREWMERACRVTHGDDIGFVKGRIEHYFHGRKPDRKYRERWEIQIDHAFDPHTDLAYDSQGLIQIIGKPRMLSDFRDYFRGRNEDSLDAY